MTDARTLDVARAAGLEVEWSDQEGRPHTVGIDVLRAVLAALGLPVATDVQCRASAAEAARLGRADSGHLLTASFGQPFALPGRPGPWRITLERRGHLEGPGGAAPGLGTLPIGYHQLAAPGWSGTLAVAPDRGWTLEDAGSGGPLAGLAVQLYALSRRNDGGCGDFAALAELARRAARRGIDALAISPVHALFTADPARAAPYAPSSRLALNPAYAACDAGRAEGAEMGLIDWGPVVTARLVALREDFVRDAASPAFAAFRRHAPPALRHHALFEAIAAAEVASGGSADWRRWPSGLASPESHAARRFAADVAGEVAFQLYLQYRAAAGFDAAQAAARQGGMRVGLIADLAVGGDPGGSDAWMNAGRMLRGLSIGAPPDAFNRAGQNWGLTTFSPFGLRESGFAGWIAMLRAAFAHAGGIRIDHALGLARLWVIPEGAGAGEGVYLGYPCRDLMRLLALESFRHHAVILAEDLGTVPAGLSERLAATGVAGLRVLWFERMATGFRPPGAWQEMAAAMTSTHDLPTVAGWWQERDIDWRLRLGLPHETRAARRRDRHLLWRAFRAAGTARGEEPGTNEGGRVATAAAGFLGRTASRLALLPLEDALALAEQPNLPGTTAGHPNWRRRLPERVETMLDRPDVAARLHALQAARGGSGRPP
ncbi:MAG TPA: 4-alpha-glucanotransferase [Acetobacteraceae bacterium]|nr:4-alpha-glucanotransferase [Acetobacteraceae bacterium]